MRKLCVRQLLQLKHNQYKKLGVGGKGVTGSSLVTLRCGWGGSLYDAHRGREDRVVGDHFCQTQHGNGFFKHKFTSLLSR